MNINHLLLLLSLCLFTLAPARAAERTFDQWADDFAVRWVRLNPQFATQSQYFSGAEQDENDRQLVLGGSYGDTYGVKAARARADLARRWLRELGRGVTESKAFPETTKVNKAEGMGLGKFRGREGQLDKFSICFKPFPGTPCPSESSEPVITCP